jgi:hypothetical protein
MKKQIAPVEYMVCDAIENGLGDLEGLRDELQDWLDNMPENLQQSSKADEVQEAIDGLDGVDSFRIPDALESEKDSDDKPKLGGIRFQFMTGKRAKSRAQRRDEATSLLRAAVEAVRDDLDEKQKTSDDEYEDVTSELDELEQIIDSAEGVDFPGAR